MKVKITHPAEGLQAGKIVELDDKVAERLIKERKARAVKVPQMEKVKYVRKNNAK